MGYKSILRENRFDGQTHIGRCIAHELAFGRFHHVMTPSPLREER